MRGGDKRTGELFSYVDLEKRVRSDHPLKAIRGLVNEALVALERVRDQKCVQEVTFSTIFCGVLPFILTDLIRLVILIAFPILALWLPSHM